MEGLNFTHCTAAARKVTNVTNSMGDVEEYIFDKPHVRILFIFLYTVVFCFCFFGNLAVVLVVTLHWRMRRITKFCLGNLAFANLCVGIFCVYQNLSMYLMERWIFGYFMCKMYHFINGLSHNASILIHVVVCVERYLAILHPFKCKHILTITRLRIVIMTVWAASALLSSPRLYYFSTYRFPNSTRPGEPRGYYEMCGPQRHLYDSHTMDMINFVVLFIIPLSVILVLYTRMGIFLRHNAVIQQTKFHLSKCSESVTPPTFSSSSVKTSSSDNKKSIALKKIHKRRRTLHARNKHQRRSIFSALTPPRRNSLPTETTKVAKYNKSVKIKSFESVRFEKERYPKNELCPETQLKKDNPGCSKRCKDIRRENYSVAQPGISIVQRSATDPFLKIESAESDILNYDQNSVASCSNKSKHRCNAPVTQFLTSRRLKILKPRQAVVRMLIAIVITFAICNLPFHLRKIFQNYLTTYDFGSSFSFFFTPSTFLLMYANCAINPILYAFLSKSFRASLKDLLDCKLGRSMHRQESVVV